ncbi:MAG: hypothetical protein M0Q12_03950 [Synergistaceae bacterium]|jgi:hypothetical protein|nr:hypothetical protein [Synergistaceae bacterium]MDY0316381.1 hypothetical protein [Acholeplasmatales bacterium]
MYNFKHFENMANNNMNDLEKIQFKKSTILASGLTAAETERRMNEKIASLYVEFWEKGLTPKYRDNRCKSDKEFIGANADGSEDLLLFNSENRTYTILRQLVPPGQGQYAILTERIRYSAADVH